MPKEPFVVNRIKSVGYAFKGLFILLKTESSIKIQFFIAVFVTAMGFYFKISAAEWMFQSICIGIVMGAEGLNTAIEKLADFVQPDFDEKIGRIKTVKQLRSYIKKYYKRLGEKILYLDHEDEIKFDDSIFIRNHINLLHRCFCMLFCLLTFPSSCIAKWYGSELPFSRPQI